MNPFRRSVYTVLMAMIQNSLWMLRRLDRWRYGNPPARSDEAFRLSPYETYDRVRSMGPVIRSWANRGWLVYGFDEVQDVLADPGFSSDLRRNRFMHGLLRVASNGLDIPLLDKPAMLNRDPPDHTRLRKLVARGFVSNAIQSLEPMIERLVDELLAGVGSEFDVISRLAKPLPAMVIAEMMGVPRGERALFERWSKALTGATMIDRPGMIESAAVADREMRRYLENLIETGRNSDQGLISALLAAQQDNDHLTRDEVISNCILLLTAGHETTTRLIGNGLFLLLRYPDQLLKLRENPSLMENAIEEMLRFESPIQITLRIVKEDMAFHGHRFRRNQLVLVGIGAANRDPKANPEPAVFDIERKPSRHVAFGYGIHLCLGMALARLEGRIVLAGLLQRFPSLRYLDDSPDWGRNPFFRGLESLRVGTT